MRIAMIGQKGLPATYGGVERHVEEIGARLAGRGHDVAVYARPGYRTDPLDRWRGMEIRTVGTLPTKHLDAIVHSAVSTAHAISHGVDLIHYHALGPGLVSPAGRYLSRAAVVQTIHGRDDLRAKWGGGAQTVLRLGAWMSTRVPDATIGVSEAITRDFPGSTYIPNGVERSEPVGPGRTLADLGLEPFRYVLFVGRLVPEKNPDVLIEAFSSYAGDARLAVVGGSSFSDAFVDTLSAAASADPRVVMAGYRYGDELAELYSNAAAFVLPSKVEGLPITLLEAASYGTPVVVSDIEPHLEVVGEAGSHPGAVVFPVGDRAALSDAIGRVFADPAALREGGRTLQDDVLARYRWDAVVDATVDAYDTAVSRRKRRPRAASRR